MSTIQTSVCRSTLLTNALPQRSTICCYLMVTIAMMRQANHCQFPYIVRPRGLLCEFGCTGVYCIRLLQATSLLPQNCQLSSFIPKYLVYSLTKSVALSKIASRSSPGEGWSVMTGAQSAIEVPYMSSNIIKRGHVCAPKPCMATSMSSSADVIPANGRQELNSCSADSPNQFIFHMEGSLLGVTWISLR